MTVLNGLDKQMARCAEENQSCSQANQSPCLQMSHRVKRWCTAVHHAAALETDQLHN